MLKKIFCLWGLFFFVFSAHADIIPFKYLNEGHGTIVAQGKKSGQDRWSADFDISKGKDGLVIVEKRGKGYFGADNIYQTWHSRGTFNLVHNHLIPVEVKDVFYDQQGKIINSVEKKYDANAQQVFCKINGKQKTFAFTDDVVDDINLSLMMANFPFDQQSIKFHLLTLEPDLYGFTAKLMGTESLNIGGVVKNCYKIKLTVNLGILGALVPDTYFWVEIDPPHRFVRYQGLESGLNTPTVVISRKNTHGV